MIGTIQQYIDDAKMSLQLGQGSLEDLLPSSIRKEIAQAQRARKLNPCGDVAEKYMGQGLLNDDGLRVYDLLSTLEDIVFCCGRLEGAKMRLAAAAHEPNLKLTKHRDR
jgi:tRNA G37 N-methylase TrmD